MSVPSSSDRAVVWLRADGDDLDPARHGAKACGLQELLRLGLAVPAGFVVPIDAAAAMATAVRDGVRTDLVEELRAAVDALEREADGPLTLAVRSGAAASLPGGYETLLDVKPDEVPGAVAAVVASSGAARADAVARAMGGGEAPPTAVIVQRQVDTRLDDRSGAGVVTSRDPVSGAPGLFGAVAWQARGDAVMAGTIPVDPVATIDVRCPQVAHDLRAEASRLEEELGSPVELELAVSAGALWYLQLRRFPPPAPATPDRDDRRPPGDPAARGQPASAGIATGALMVDLDDALDAIDAGRSVIVALETTSPGDVEVMVGAAGVITVLGSPQSHAAVVTRAAGVPAVVSVQGMTIDANGIALGGEHIGAGTGLTIDGAGGAVWVDPP